MVSIEWSIRYALKRQGRLAINYDGILFHFWQVSIAFTLPIHHFDQFAHSFVISVGQELLTLELKLKVHKLDK